MSIKTVPGEIRPVGYEQLTGLSSAQTLQEIPVAPDKPNAARIQAESKDVRWRDDGVEPSETVGMILGAGEAMLYFGDLSAICFIDGASPNAKVNVCYYQTG